MTMQQQVKTGAEDIGQGIGVTQVLVVRHLLVVRHRPASRVMVQHTHPHTFTGIPELRLGPP
jgi:hypothetical protein